MSFKMIEICLGVKIGRKMIDHKLADSRSPRVNRLQTTVDHVHHSEIDEFEKHGTELRKQTQSSLRHF